MHHDQFAYLSTMTVAMVASSLVATVYAVRRPPRGGNLRWLCVASLAGLLAFVLLFWIDPNNVVRPAVTSPLGVLLVAAIRFPLFTAGTLVAFVSMLRASEPRGWATAFALVLMLSNIPWVYLSTV